MATVAVTPDQNVIVAEIFIAAPPARVFEAITDPHQTPKWWGQEGVYRITDCKADLRPGGKWSSTGVGERRDGGYTRGGQERIIESAAPEKRHTSVDPSTPQRIRFASPLLR
jgi:uncharacterized protein YndB with AHSA1/START domain